MKWFLLLLNLISAQVFFAQNIFFELFDFKHYDSVFSLIETEDGYVIMTNCNYTEGEPSPPILMKIDKQGSLKWTFSQIPFCYDSDFPITAHRCILAPDSTILVCGRLSLSDTVGAVFVMKVDPFGDLIWRKIYKPYLRTKETNWTEQIATWPNGDFLVTGVYYKLDQGGETFPDSMFLFKCNAVGEMLHETKINYPPAYWAAYEGGDSGNPVILPDGDIFYGFFARWDTRYHPIICRLDSTLNLEWRKEADGVMGRLYELKMASDGNILMFVEGGYNNYPWGVDPIIQKLTPEGDSLWTYSPPGINSQEGRDMSTLTNGDIVYTSNPEGYEGVTCISFEGKYKWKKHYNPPMGYPYDRHKFTRIIGTSDGGMLIAGEYLRDRFGQVPEVFDNDVLVLKLDSMGCLLPGCGSDNYFVAAQEPNEVSSKTQERFMWLHTNMPRPDAPIELRFTEGFDGGSLRLINAKGQVLWQQTVTESWELEIPTTGLSSGVYFLVLEGDRGILQTERVMIVF